MRREGDNMERRGGVKSRNMYKGPMDKAKGGSGRVSGGEKMETTVLEQQ